MARILVVEDDPGCQRLMRLLLSSRQHQVTVTGDGSDAVDRVLSETFDVVICDLNLPGMSGCEVARRIKMTRPAVVLIAVSGYVRISEDPFSSGFIAVLPKPVKPATFAALIEAQLEAP